MTAALLDHEGCRQRVADGVDDERVRAHLAACPTCTAFAERVRVVLRLAPEIGIAAPPGDLDDRVVAALRATTGAPKSADRRLRRFARRAVRPMVGAAATVALSLGLVPAPGESGPRQAQAANVLLASAQETAARGTARLRLDGRAELVPEAGRGAPTSVTFGGFGELGEGRLHYRGTTRVGGPTHERALAPFEVTVVGRNAWSRQADGSWVQVDQPIGPLAPLVLDAGSVLELLRLPKQRLHHLGTETVGGEPVRRFRFLVQPAAGDYVVDAWVGQDDLLRQLSIESRGVLSTSEGVFRWHSSSTVRLFAFGGRVSIAPPAPGEVSTQPAPDSAAAAVRFPFSWPARG